MYVCLMRHGKAQPFDLHQPDKLRELTEKGCNQASSMAKWGLVMVAVGENGPVGQPIRADVSDSRLFRKASAY